jgi:tetratricopeptide (TPR) repeat protein
MTAPADSGEPTAASTEAAAEPAASTVDATSGTTTTATSTSNGGRPRATPFRAAADSAGGGATQAYNDYQSALAQVQRDVAERQAAAGTTYSKAVAAAQQDNTKVARDAYLEYVKEFHRAQVDPEAASGTDLYRAQSEYQEANQAANQATQEAVDAANRAYAEEMQAIQSELETRWEAAYADYVEALHESFTAADPATFDAATLTSIAQSMLYAAASATSCTSSRAS